MNAPDPLAAIALGAMIVVYHYVCLWKVYDLYKQVWRLEKQADMHAQEIARIRYILTR